MVTQKRYNFFCLALICCQVFFSINTAGTAAIWRDLKFDQLGCVSLLSSRVPIQLVKLILLWSCDKLRHHALHHRRGVPSPPRCRQMFFPVFFFPVSEASACVYSCFQVWEGECIFKNAIWLQCGNQNQRGQRCGHPGSIPKKKRSTIKYI